MRNFVRRAAAVAAAGAMLLGLAACSPSTQSDSGGGSETAKVVKLGWVPALGWGAFGALSLHKYKGFEVELLNFSSSTDIMTALVRGSLDMGIISNTAIAGGLDQGTQIPLQGVAGSSLRPTVLLVGKQSGISTWDDIKGKQVGLVSGSEESFQFESAASAHGLKAGQDFEVVNFQQGSDELLALQRGDIDMTITYEPLGTQAVMQGFADKASDEITDGFYDATFEISSSAFVSDGFLKDHEDQVVTIIKQYVEIVKSYDDLSKAADDYLKLQPGDDDVIRKAALNTVPNYKIDQKDLETAISSLHTYGVTKQDQAAAVVGLMNYDILSKATGETPQALGKSE